MKQTMDNQEQMDYKKLYEAEREKTEVLVSKIEESEKEIEELKKYVQTKKYVEEGNMGGKGSDSHKATVVGDTVGDPFKDTSGPSLNILIKLMSMVAIVMAGLTIAYSIF